MKPQESQFLRQVDAVIERNLHNESFSTGDLARAVFLCRMQLHRRLVWATSLSASRYIRLFRMKKAVQMLQSSPKSISEISFEVGFSWPPYFSKCFKEQYGVCPGIFRGYFREPVKQELSAS